MLKIMIYYTKNFSKFFKYFSIKITQNTKISPFPFLLNFFYYIGILINYNIHCEGLAQSGTR